MLTLRVGLLSRLKEERQEGLDVTAERGGRSTEMPSLPPLSNQSR